MNIILHSREETQWKVPYIFSWSFISFWISPTNQYYFDLQYFNHRTNLLFEKTLEYFASKISFKLICIGTCHSVTYVLEKSILNYFIHNLFCSLICKKNWNIYFFAIIMSKNFILLYIYKILNWSVGCYLN